MPLHNRQAYFVIGGQKCGTSSLYYTFQRYLPGKIISDKDQLNKFLSAKDISGKIYVGSDDIYHPDRYDTIFNLCKLKKIQPHFIILIRHPIERSLSHCLHIARKKGIKYIDSDQYQTIYKNSRFKYYLNFLKKRAMLNKNCKISLLKMIDAINNESHFEILSLFSLPQETKLLHENKGDTNLVGVYSFIVSKIGYYIRLVFGLNFFFLVRQLKIHKLGKKSSALTFKSIINSDDLINKLETDLCDEIDWYEKLKKKTNFFYSRI